MNSDQAVGTKRKPGFRPGISVKSGKLYAFSEVRVIVMRGWPEMSAWTRTFCKPQWSRLRPEIDFSKGIVSANRSRHRFHSRQLIEPASDSEALGRIPKANDSKTGSPNSQSEAYEQEKKLVRDYFGNVPEAVRIAITPFQNRQWHLHVMATRCAGSLDLIASNPALAYCLASGWVFSPRPSKEATRLIRRLIGTKRRIICETLGFQDTESSVAVLSKIPASSCSIPCLLTIRDLLREPDWRKPLLHLPSLNSAVLLFVCNRAFRRRTSPQLLYELSRNPSYLFKEMIVLLSLEKKLGKRGPEQFRSVRQLLDHLLELLWRANMPKKIDEVAGPFPKPPIPGNDSIVPLENLDSLLAEGDAQHNCVPNYRHSVSAGRMYVYRVLKPERATLSLVPCAGGGWQLEQLLAAYNQPVAEETRQAVNRWMMDTENRRAI